MQVLSDFATKYGITYPLLSDEGSGVRREGHGAELSDLAPEEQVVNAAADDGGALHLAGAQGGVDE